MKSKGLAPFSAEAAGRLERLKGFARHRSTREVAPALGPVLDFMSLLWSVDHEVQRVSRRMAAGIGITGPQRLVIRIVGRYPGILPGRLARTLKLHPGTLTVVLQQLERKGLVKRTRDVADRRRQHVWLTERGRASSRRRAGTVESAVSETLQSVTPAQAQAARKLLSALAMALRANAPGR